MSEKSVKQLEQEILEVKVARLINLHDGVVLRKGVTFGEIIFSQQDVAKKIVAMLREYLV